MNHKFEDIYELTPLQEGILFHSLAEVSASVYMEQYSFNIKGAIDIAGFNQAFNLIFKRHDILRTAFVFEKIEKPLQVVLKNREIAVAYKETGYLSRKKEIDQFVEEFKKNDREAGFDLSKDVLMRVSLIKVGDQEYKLIWTWHHILFDGWCTRVLAAEVLRTYHSLISGKPLVLPPPVPYKEYIKWLNGTRHQSAEEYWKNYVRDFSATTKLLDEATVPFGQRYCKVNHDFHFEGDVTQRLVDMAKTQQVTLNILLKTIWAVLLLKYNNNEDVIFGEVVSGRPPSIPDVERIIGLFINTIPIRFIFSKEESFLSALRKAQKDAAATSAFHHFPLVNIQQFADTKGELFNHLFSFQNYPETAADEEGPEDKLEISDLEIFDQTSYDFEISFFPGSRLLAKAGFNSEVYSPSFIDQLMMHFANLVDQVLANAEVKISELALLSPAQEKEVLTRSEGPVVKINTAAPVDVLIDEICRKYPEKPAIRFGATAISYNELYTKTNRLAYYLTGRDLGKGDIVGILMDRSPDFVESILGIWKANAAYMPVDPSLPYDRILEMLEASSTKFLITGSAYLDLADKLIWDNKSLTGYLCPGCRRNDVVLNDALFREQQAFWEAVAEDGKDDIATGGWFSSYTGQPLSAAEMQEYSGNVLTKLLPYLSTSSKVLEIGCGSGFTMFHLAPLVSEYVAIDQSAVTLSRNQEIIDEKGIHNIRQLHLPAHLISGIEGSFDVIIMNSVIQDFGNHQYLKKVLSDAIGLLSNTGILFLGDIMDRDSKHELLHSLKTFKEQHPGTGYITKVNWSNELFVSRSFYDDFAYENPVVKEVMHTGKLGVLENELTRFRYDTILVVDKKVPSPVNGYSRQKYQDFLDELMVFPATRNDARQPSGADLAYVLFTSGSTGIPKGVMIEHGSMLNHKLAMIRSLGIGSDTILAQTASASFDISVWQFITALIAGGTTAIYTEQNILDVAGFLAAIEADGVKILEIVPSYLQLILEVAEDTGLQLSSLQYLIITGESVAPVLVDRWFSHFPAIKMINAYGPAEAGDDVALFFMDSAPHTNNVAIGRPLQNLRIYVLNSEGQLCPPGVQGEICVAGAGVGRGYINLKDNPSFTADPFYPGERMYKTGDLGKYSPEGNLFFLGRQDSQVKIRGHRIEPGEIDACISGIPGVALSCTVVREEKNGEHSLWAYVSAAAKGGITIEQIQAGLYKSLPEYMRPGKIIILDEMPLLSNGKINRKVLTARVEAREEKQFLAPQTETEIRLARIWEEVLDVDNVGLNDNFFELGGHSLKAIRLASKIHKLLHADVNLRDIFYYPVLSEFCTVVEKARTNTFSDIPALPEQLLYQTSHAQRRLWILSQFEATSVAYNECDAYEIIGSFNRPLFEQAINILINRHEILRTTFETADNEIFQKVHQLVDFNFKVQYINLQPELDPDVEVRKITDQLVHEPFDLKNGPLFRVTLIKIAEEKHIVLTNMHHIINDGWSDAVFIQDLITIYTDLDEGKEVHLSPLTIQYKDFSAWQNNQFQQSSMKVHEQYWLNRLAGTLTVLDLPASYHRPDNITYNGRELVFDFSQTLTRQLNEFSTKHGITLYSTLVAILNVLFNKYTNEKDIILGTYNGSRDHPDLEGQIGFYINTLVLRNHVNVNESFVSFARSVGNTNLEALEHRIYPFDLLMDKLDVKRDLSRAPLFDVLVGLQNFNDTVQRKKVFAGNFQVRKLPVNKLTSIYDLNFMFREEHDRLQLNIRFNTDIYSEQDVNRIFRHYRQLSEWLMSRPFAKIGKAMYLTDEDRAELNGFNSTREIDADLFLPEIISGFAAEVPHKVAIAHRDQHCTYQELDRDQMRIAHFITSRRLNAKVVGVLSDRSIPWVKSILGIWAADSIYLPLNPGDPIDRLLLFLNDCGVNLLIFEAKHAALASALQWRANELYTIYCVDSTDFYGIADTGRDRLSRQVWEHVGDQATDEILGGGWINSYTGAPFSKLEMDEYADNVYQKLLPYLKPGAKVLEIGCASGITMFRIAPLVAKYIATDISAVILEKNRKEIEERGLQHIEAYCMSAIEIDQIEERDFDIVIINSVVQNFGDYNYLRKVLSLCVDLAGEKGVIFLGDLMDEDKREALELSCRSCEQAGLAGQKTKTDWTHELFINKAFLDNLKVQVPEIKAIQHSSKIHTIKNELTDFRFDSIAELDKINARNKRPEIPRFNQFDAGYACPEEVGLKPDGQRDAAYIIYTSGSTGKPKGAIVTHQGMMNHLDSKKNVLEITRESIIAQSASQTFDVSVWQFALALYAGGTTRIFDKEAVLDIPDFVTQLRNYEVNIFEVVPSYLNGFLYELEQHDSKCRLDDLKMLVTCGEVLPPRLTERWFNIFPDIPIVNAYGPTEASCDITHHKMMAPVNGPRVLVGTPVQNLQVRIVNDEMQLCPVNVKGEIVVTGVGVGKGYVNNQARTEEVFLNDPFAGPGGKLYRTGDIGRFLSTGEIDFFGRKDNQVKVRGIRIELGELETVIGSIDLVKECAVITREVNGDLVLLAFVSMKKEMPDSSLLKMEVARRLPEYMMPEEFVVLERLPVLSNGKIDRKALDYPSAVSATLLDPQEFSVTERALYELWAEVIGHDGFTRKDNFFNVGGHSLKAMRLIALVAEKMGTTLTFRELFINSTLEGMARLISLSRYNKYNFIERVGKREYYELSGAQKRLWILCQFEEALIAYNEFSAFRYKGNLDAELIRQAFFLLVERHEILRTVIVTINEEPVQQVIPADLFPVEFAYIADGWSVVLEDEAEKERQKPFSLDKGPLARIKIINRTGESYALLTLHHLITDGWSAAVFMHDFFLFYEKLSRKTDPELPPLSIQYKDYAAWKNAQLKGKAGAGSARYWKEKMGGNPPRLNLSTVASRPRVQTYNGNSVIFNLDQDVCEAVALLKDRFGCSTFVVLNIMLDLLLYKITGQPDIVTGTIVAGRDQPDSQHLIGLFVNTVPVRLLVDTELTLGAFIDKARNEVIEALSFGQYPFDQLLEDLKIDRDLSRPPLFDVVIECHEFDDIFDWQKDTGVQDRIIEPVNFGSAKSIFDISFIFSREHNDLQLEVEYNTGLYAEAQIKGYAALLQDLIKRVPASLDQRVRDFKILPAQGEKEMLLLGAGPVNQFDENKPVDVLIDEMCLRYKEKTAVSFGNITLSYQALYEGTNKIAHYLLAHHIGREDVVGILMNRCPEFPESMLGIWKANAAYMPIDPEIPYNRMRQMIDASGTKMLVFTRSCQDIAERLLIDCSGLTGSLCADDPEMLSSYPATPTGKRRPSGKDLAYILFTSGSTGAAKGVMIEHRSMLNHNLAKINAVGIDADTILAQTASVSFDISIWQFIAALLRGGTTAIYSEQAVLDVEGFLRQIVADQVNILEVVPSYLQLVLEVIADTDIQFSCLKYLITTGEAVAPVLIQKWFGYFPDIKIINAFGPSEAADDITHYVMERPPVDNNVPIGKTIQNMRIYVLSQEGHLCPCDVQGEICVAGIGVGRGYVNLADNRSFGEDPFYPGERMYRTGDWGRYTADGNLLFSGRRDSQVKIRGHRIELGEIEATMNGIRGVGLACVVIREDAGRGEQAIYAYVSAAAKELISAERIREKLIELLPEYMIPVRIIILDELPLLPSGKIDRNALLSDIGLQEGLPDYIAPGTEMEIKLAEIWQEVLGVGKVGLNDNFYELGGDSLGLVKVYRKVSKVYPVKLDLADYFSSRTISELSAKLLKKGTRSFGSQDDGSLFYLQRGIDKHKHNLFIFPPAGGLGIYYRDLIGFLDQGHNCHLFNYRGIGKNEQPFADLEDVVTYYSAIILGQINDNEEINLVGASSGGNLIFEIAAFLEQKGYKCFLIMLDSEPTVIAESEEFIATYIKNVGEFVNDTEQGKIFIERYEVALRAYMGIFNSELQQLNKKISSDITNFICKTSSHEVQLWDHFTSGNTRYITLEEGEHMDFIESEENLILISEEITQSLMKRTITHEHQIRKMV
ncbi:non-ribosomal peptide synthetase [Chitinophaga sp. GbtcB8]|uniref:non-ribosomal peptide synthetase n=1 Tax=Chitinophaga sp. GbtcB8 TaxID=2824753 RepID=UPI001C2FC3CA|nr:non-ribosomal peptide synthetase [Chitinophaga sp. GbtcB8]